MQPQKHGRSGRASSTLQHHSPGGALATVTCSYRMAQMDSWQGKFGTRHHDDDTTEAPALS
jgi:hypothetical protein